MAKLNKFIAESGICSRRNATDLIKSGQVTVNGTVLVEPFYEVLPTDAIKVFKAIEPKASGFDQQKIQDAIAAGKKYGIQWVADAVQDFSTGAARGAIQPMTLE